MSAWDKSAVYDAEIAPLMQRIVEICQREQIPVVAVFQDQADPVGTVRTVVVDYPHCDDHVMWLGINADRRRWLGREVFEAIRGLGREKKP